jgi:serine phosphatase RsbU (regulator of sigma subunit)
VDSSSRLVQLPVESGTDANGAAPLPRRREHDLARLATFTLDSEGRLTSWSVTATEMFGLDAAEVTGQHVGDVLMTGPGQREVMGQALAEAAGGQVHTATVAGGSLGEGRFVIRCEPLAALGGGVLVIVQRIQPRPAPSWLSEATARIGSSLDLEETAAEVADAAVPEFADMTIIYAAERLLAAGEMTATRSEGAAVRRLAARMPGQPDLAAAKRASIGEVLVLGPETPGSRAMTTATPVLFDHIDDETARRLARQHGTAQKTDHYTSYLAMPLIARGVIVGCAIFGREQASPPFSSGNIAVAGELASRAAVCIDNARLYDRERRTAQALQQGLLPGEPEVPAGLEVAHRYVPVGDSVVGGDWHDIVPLPGGRAALIVGDAMGHGPEAAAVMVQLRTAAHTLADLELPPAEVLSRLDRMATGITAAPFATCIYAVIDPPRGSCEIAQAGHLPPALVPAEGEPVMLDLPPGLPLGLGAESFHSTQISLPPGTALALYTDGLVESRIRTLDAGLAALRDALAAALAQPHAELDEACDTVTQKLRQHGEDDITLVIARIRQ